MRVHNNNSSVITEKVKPTIHNVHILDASGSMSGSKYTNGIKGINTELEKLKLDTEANYTQSEVVFCSRSTDRYNFLTPIKEAKIFKPRNVSSLTPLYQVIGTIIEELLTKVKPEDRVIITITTDGGENDSKGKYKDPKVLSELIERVKRENNFTVTFMGTYTDTESIIRNLNIDRDNTLVHENTGESLAAVYNTRTTSLQSYSKSVVTEDLKVTTTFFKSISK